MIGEKGSSMPQVVFVCPLSVDEQRQLEQTIRRSTRAKVVRRAQVVRLSSQGYRASHIARLFGLHRFSILQIIHAFNTKGLTSLAGKPRPGRPPKVQATYVELLTQAVQRSPRALGYPFSNWTLARLREHLTRQTGIVLHPDYLSRLMAKHRIVYRRPKHLMSHLRDPKEYREKQAILAFLKKCRPGGQGL